ncbi:MAG: DUF4230 domain-containing protein [Planctomycetota bacterium]
MRWTHILVGATAIWIGLVLTSRAYDALATEPETPPFPTPPSIAAIRDLSELVLLEIEAIEVVTTSVEGRVGGTTVIASVQGIVTLGVDLDQACFVEVDQERQHLVLALPPPMIRRVAIDPVTSRALHTRRDGLWQIAVGSAHENRAFAQALVIGQQRLENAASRSDLTARAKRHAEAVLQRFASEIEWTLEVRWEE